MKMSFSTLVQGKNRMLQKRIRKIRPYIKALKSRFEAIRFSAEIHHGLLVSLVELIEEPRITPNNDGVFQIMLPIGPGPSAHDDLAVFEYVADKLRLALRTCPFATAQDMRQVDDVFGIWVAETRGRLEAESQNPAPGVPGRVN